MATRSLQATPSLQQAHRGVALMGAIALVALAWAPGNALAGTTGAEFQPMFQLLTDWIGGYLGRSIAIGAFIIGVGYGAFAQRYLVALGGIFVALLVLIVPQVLNGMLTATI